MARLSGLQKEVLRLYRHSLRCVRTKPEEFRSHWKAYVKEEFARYDHIQKKQFSVVEHLIRTGHRKLEMYSNPNIKNIH
ncbi:succinate dehydrogenase assembly factor 1, mitochondrial [[Candida] railenensis]|uniref:Succinate dehydrogenase assembly factor 1, mitochondrial n=1 Tax=[Candida] railenensis TaxID=45579 RepID=A0A9P0QND5_9ASCO|nr:succinate dehydrogenase assembly factor 1, mitochondrial [[Candida] railenensis]